MEIALADLEELVEVEYAIGGSQVLSRLFEKVSVAGMNAIAFSSVSGLTRFKELEIDRTCKITG